MGYDLDGGHVIARRFDEGQKNFLTKAKRGSKLSRQFRVATRRNSFGTSRLLETSDLIGSFKREKSSLMLTTSMD